MKTKFNKLSKTRVHSGTLTEAGVIDNIAQRNMLVIQAAKLGLSTAGIAKIAGLTEGQVDYRMNVFGLRRERRDFRSCRGKLAQEAIENRAKCVQAEGLAPYKKFAGVRKKYLRYTRSIANS